MPSTQAYSVAAGAPSISLDAPSPPSRISIASTNSGRGPTRSIANPASVDGAALASANGTNTPAATAALRPRSAKIPVWWKTSAVTTSGAVVSGSASSQNVAEVSTRRSSTPSSATVTASSGGGWSAPSGCSPICSGVSRANSAAAGITSSHTITSSAM